MRRLLSCAAGVLLLSSTVLGQGTAQPEVRFDFSRWPYPVHQETANHFQELTRQYPKLARVHNIGKSGKGRDLWVIEITNSDTGPGGSKPGLWMDGNIHAAEVTGRQLVMYFVERLLQTYGKDPEVTRLVDTHTFYVLPALDVDGGELALTRHPAWPGYKPEEHPGKDLDGDGYILMMRVKDPKGDWFPSPIDPRVMVHLRTRVGRWAYVPTTAEAPGKFEEDAVPPAQRYSLYVEGDRVVPERSIDSLGWGLDSKINQAREPANFNRNWAAEWEPDEPGAGPFPFSLPETRAVAEFITSHNNIFFHDTIHSGGTGKNYIVRPPMKHSFEFIPPEDNDFYATFAGPLWALLSGGGAMNNDYYSQIHSPGHYGQDESGFSNDWAYLHVGIHSLLHETGAAGGKDYDGDGFFTIYEVMRWNDEEKGGKYFVPWKPYKHPVLGDVEIGGPRMPMGIDERLKKECETYYRLLTQLAGYSPLLRIKSLTSERAADGTFRVVATIQNQGFLSTYVTRQALKIQRDFPVMAGIKVTGGELLGKDETKKVGHILGRIAYYRQWMFGGDQSTRTVEWKIKPSGAGPVSVSVEVWAAKAGRDQRTVTVQPATAQR